MSMNGKIPVPAAKATWSPFGLISKPVPRGPSTLTLSILILLWIWADNPSER